MTHRNFLLLVFREARCLHSCAKEFSNEPHGLNPHHEMRPRLVFWFIGPFIYLFFYWFVPALISHRDQSERHISYPGSNAHEAGLEQFRRRLRESRDSICLTSREQRGRNRLSHQTDPCNEDQRIVSDGLAYSSQRDVDLHSNVHQPMDSHQNFQYRAHEAPIINLEEVGVNSDCWYRRINLSDPQWVFN